MRKFSLLLVATLIAAPLAAAVAQGTTSPDIKAGSASEADAVKNGAATGSGQSGATGSAAVHGTNSTIAGDQKATDRVKTGGGGGGGK